ncbi:MAG: MmgE/PrpD family protein [Phycisphaerales bacterium]|nr:MmgE/PrpD family protein [Phycisphaerales bacterium]
MSTKIDTSNHVVLNADTNQALGIGEFAVAFMHGSEGRTGGLGQPDASVIERTNMFHVDAVICGVSALALGTNAPTLLREEALRYRAPSGGFGSLAGPGGTPRLGATVFGSSVPVFPEKAIVANSAAVREWDSNGTNFGYNPSLGHTAGEFGHNDFYPVAIAAAQLAGKDGEFAMRGMILLDEIRGRLAEVFSLKTYKIDHVLHGAIASAATYGAMLGATAQQIEHAIGMVVAHHVPFRAIRAGKQLSDSKGSSAAISTEAAVVCMQRAMHGFLGPKDIFRNPEAVFCLFQKPPHKGHSPFNLILSRAGSDFAVMGMHFKLGLYEHQSAGAIQALIDLLKKNPGLLEAADGARIKDITIVAYEPAFGIIGDPAKRDPRTRQSADHSMVYIIATLLRKALQARSTDWAELMLGPYDYNDAAIHDPLTRKLMAKIQFKHGGQEYDAKYPEGIPTSMVITDDTGGVKDSGLVMFPTGHARNTTANLKALLNHKFHLLGSLATDQPAALVKRFDGLQHKSAEEIASLHDFAIINRGRFE